MGGLKRAGIAKQRTSAHLTQLRRGWENEHLAAYLLSRLAFVARPVAVSDDVGVDLFCTLFETRAVNGREFAFPRNSVAVQVKSADGPVNVVGKIEYLQRLEVPFYLGIVRCKSASLTLYSTRYLCHAFANYKSEALRSLIPVELTVGPSDYRVGNDDCYDIRCPAIASLRAMDGPAEVATMRRSLAEDAALALRWIVSLSNSEFIFEDTNSVHIFAGRTSATAFRSNFQKRLAEALLNLEWLVSRKQSVDPAEIKTYVEIDQLLASVQGREPYLENAKDRLLRVLRWS